MRLQLLFSVAMLGCVGCLSDEMDRESGGIIQGRKIETPQINEASIECAARVDQVGRLVVSQNPFLGLNPNFQTFGLPDPEIWHPDFNAVFITDALVKQCSTDEELAAVLANELATMAAEQQTSKGFRTVEPLQMPPESNFPGGGTIASQAHDLGIQALADKKLGRARRSGPTDAQIEERATEILKSAGYDPKLLPQVRPLIQQARKNSALARQFGGPGEKPNWTR